MAFRNIIITDRCKLEYSLNCLIYRKGLEEKRIILDEIRLIIIVSTQVAITSSLIMMLSKKKIKLIFCDEKHNPECEMVSYQNNSYSYRKIKEQIVFVKEQGSLWKIIIQEKIKNQAKNLLKQDFIDEYNLLMKYSNEIRVNDETNREGHSAKVYFNALFGKDFNRDLEIITNKYLNYGYTILLSAINREIKMLGYLTELGIHHIGESNPFNLSCDFIEPLRPLVDMYVINNLINEDNYKVKFVEMLSIKVMYNDKSCFLDNAIHLYVINLFEYMKNNDTELKFIEYEL